MPQITPPFQVLENQQQKYLFARETPRFSTEARHLPVCLLTNGEGFWCERSVVLKALLRGWFLVSGNHRHHGAHSQDSADRGE